MDCREVAANLLRGAKDEDFIADCEFLETAGVIHWPHAPTSEALRRELVQRHWEPRSIDAQDCRADAVKKHPTPDRMSHSTGIKRGATWEVVWTKVLAEAV